MLEGLRRMQERIEIEVKPLSFGTGRVEAKGLSRSLRAYEIW